VLTEKLGRAVDTCGPGQRRNRVGDLAEIDLTRPQRLLRTFAVLDVGDRAIPSDELAGLVARRRRSKQEPAIDPVVAPQAALDVERGLGGVCPPALDEPREVVGMNA